MGFGKGVDDAEPCPRLVGWIVRRIWSRITHRCRWACWEGSDQDPLTSLLCRLEISHLVQSRTFSTYLPSEVLYPDAGYWQLEEALYLRDWHALTHTLGHAPARAGWFLPIRQSKGDEHRYDWLFGFSLSLSCFSHITFLSCTDTSTASSPAPLHCRGALAKTVVYYSAAALLCAMSVMHQKVPDIRGDCSFRCSSSCSA